MAVDSFQKANSAAQSGLDLAGIGDPAAWTGAAARLGVDPAALAREAARVIAETAARRDPPPGIDYRMLVESLNDVIFSLDGEGALAYMSPAIERLSGYSLEELQGRTFFDFIHPEDLPGLMESYRNTLQGVVAPHEFRVFDKDGSTRYVRTSSRLIDPAEPARGTIGFLVDVTAERAADDALRKSQDRLDVALRGGELGLWDMFIDTGEVTVNDRWAAMLGYGLDELAPLDTAWIRLVHPDDLNWVAARLQGVIAGKAESLDAEYRMRKKGGGWVWILSRARVVERGPDGRAKRIAGTHLDITQRRQADLLLGAERRTLALLAHMAPLAEVLHEAAKSVETLIEGARGSVARIDAEGVYKIAAAPAFSAEQIACIEALANSENSTPCATAARRKTEVFALDLQTGPEWAAARDAARSMTVDALWCMPIVSSKGEVAGTLSAYVPDSRPPEDFEVQVLQAIAVLAGIAIERAEEEDERRRLEMQMLHAQKLESLGVLAGGIAHDFNNLLLSILGNADLTLADMPLDSPRRRNLEIVIASSQRAAELCNQMLAYSGKGPFAVQPVDLSAMVRDMAGLLAVSIPKNVALRLDCPESIPAIVGDPAQLRQVVMNLITNAADAVGSAEGSVTLSTGIMDCDEAYLAAAVVDDRLPAGKYVYCDVADTGAGMDEATRARIFDPFFTTKFAGRGLGLAALLGIVRRHKAAVRVESRVGKGTRFRVLFPASALPAATAPAGPPEGAVRGDGTILFVDDEEQVRLVGKSVLEVAGYAVILAGDGIEALEVFRENRARIDAVVLDLTMPRMNGAEAFNRLREMAPLLPIVLSSGYGEDDCIDQLGGASVAGFIQKPYRSQELTRAVREALERR